MPLREPDTTTVQAAADAFLSSPRYASPSARRGYTGVWTGCSPGSAPTARWPRSAGEELAGLLEH
jgi:hypothetical protein